MDFLFSAYLDAAGPSHRHGTPRHSHYRTVYIIAAQLRTNVGAPRPQPLSKCSSGRLQKNFQYYKFINSGLQGSKTRSKSVAKRKTGYYGQKTDLIGWRALLRCPLRDRRKHLHERIDQRGSQFASEASARRASERASSAARRCSRSQCGDEISHSAQPLLRRATR